MWAVLSFICVVLQAFTGLALKCGEPGMPVDGFLKNPKLVFDDGEVVQISCKIDYQIADKMAEIKLVGLENGTVIRLLAGFWFGSDFSTDFQGKRKHTMLNVTEKVFIDVELSESTTKARVFFRGNLTARNSTVDNVPLFQKMYAHDKVAFKDCPLNKDHFDCITPHTFTHVKIEVILADQNINLQQNPVDVILQIEDRETGFVVANLYHIECGKPAAPLHGTVFVTNGVAVYGCDQGYQLKGQQTKECYTSEKDLLLWQHGNPLCLEISKSGNESPVATKDVNIGLVAGLIAAGCGILILLIMGMCWLYKSIGQRNDHRESNKLPMVPMVSYPAMYTNQGFIGSRPDVILPPVPLNSGYPSPVQYPLIVSGLYTPESEFSATVYDDVANHLYERLD